MPFTVAHAAAALPVHRLGLRARVFLPLSALVVGTFAPDLEFLLRLAPHGDFGHTWLGLFVFCLPVGFIVWAVYERAVAPAIALLLPSGPRASFVRARAGAGGSRVGRGLLAIPAILAGALTHFAWDAFTHSDGFVVQHAPWLAAPGAFDIPRYHLLQHASGVLGLVVCGWAAVRWYLAHPAATRRFAPGQGLDLARVAVFVAIAGLLGAGGNAVRGPWRLEPVLEWAAVGGMATLTLGLLVAGLRIRAVRDDAVVRATAATARAVRPSPGRPRERARRARATGVAGTLPASRRTGSR